MGTLAVNGYTQLTFDSAWNILVLRQQLGSLHKSYDLRDQSVEMANGPNRVNHRLGQLIHAGAVDHGNPTGIGFGSAFIWRRWRRFELVSA